MTLLCVIAVALSAEAQTQTVLDGAYVKETNLTVASSPPSSRGGRDVRAPHLRTLTAVKINQMFYFPVDPIEDRKNLFDVIATPSKWKAP